MEKKENQLDPNEAAASLAFATHLQDGMQMAEVPEGMEEEMETPEEMPQEEVETEEVVEEPQEDFGTEDYSEEEPDQTGEKLDTLTKDFTEFKGEVKGMIETKLGDLTQTIKDALK